MMNQLDQLVQIHAALGDPGRFRLVAACLDAERCVCQLVALLDLSNAAVSRHLSILKAAGLLDARKEGRWVHYRLPDDPSPAVADTLAFIRAHADDDPAIAADRDQMDRIDAIEPVELCRMQREGCCVIPDSPTTSKECC